MHVKLFYHRNTNLAYVLLPGCEDCDTVFFEIQLLKTNLALTVPAIFEVRRIAEGDYWGHTVLKFILDPAEATGLGFEDITPALAKQLKVEPYQLGQQHEIRWRKPWVN